MNWRRNVCNHQFHNCRKGDKCGNTEECCFERDTPSGKKGNQGTCVAKGSCDFRTGLPTNKAKIPCSSQNYTEGYDGMDDNKCTNWKLIIFVLTVIITVMVSALIYMGIKLKKLM